jgi:hypothetical protein
MTLKAIFIIGIGTLFVAGLFIGWIAIYASQSHRYSDTELIFETIEEPVLSRFERRLQSKYPDIDFWVRPEGPIKVALQVGHWKNSELPDELERLRGVTTGAEGGGTTEWKVALLIAELTKELLESNGYEAELLPATVPQGYWADLFLAIHADGSPDSKVRGFKSSGPYRDTTGNASRFVDILMNTYGAVTDIPIDNNITRNMRGYYAFNWFRYDHAIHPKTTGIILETGFLTNRQDQRLLIHQPEVVARGIADSVVLYFSESKDEEQSEFSSHT